jgi:hypothetical protein
MALRLRRGTAAELNTITPEEGELIYTTDTKNLYVGDGITIGGINTNSGYTGSAGIGYAGSGGPSSSLVNGTKTASLGSDGVLTVPGSIVPDTNIAYDLGSPTNRFRDIYLSGSTIDLGGSTISITNLGQLQVNGNNATVESLANGAKTVVLNSDGALFVSGAIVPDEDAVHDLGNDSSKFRDLYLSSSINLGGTSISVNSNKLRVNGNNLTVDSLENTDKTVVLDSTGVLTVPGSIIPDTDIAYDLGSDSNRFRDLYLSGSTINLGGTSISVNSSGQLQVSGSNVTIDSLVNGTNSLTLGADGTLTLPNNALSQGPLIDFSIKTSTEIKTTATITNSGSGYGAFGQSETSGGRGDGLIVSWVAGEASSVGTVQVEDPGLGYQTGDVLTLTAGGGNATITLTLAPIIYNWTFGADAATTFPGKFNFNDQVINDYGDRAEALVFNKSTVAKSITTSGGTVSTPGVEALSIRGGNAYKNGYQNWERNGQGGDVRILAGEGNPGGNVTIRAGRSLVPGILSIEGADSQTPGTGNTNTGGLVRITGGFGSVVNDLGTGNGGAVVITGGGTYSNAGKSGSVFISGGPAGIGLPTGPGRTASAGDVVIRGGQSLDIGGKGGIVTIETNASIQRGTRNPWIFDLNGRTTFPVATAPAHSYGAAGDKAGMLAFDFTYIYYCTDDYVNNSTDIWKRVALVSAAW